MTQLMTWQLTVSHPRNTTCIQWEKEWQPEQAIKNTSKHNQHRTQHCLVSGLTDRFWLLVDDRLSSLSNSAFTVVLHVADIIFVIWLSCLWYTWKQDKKVSVKSNLRVVLSLPTSTAASLVPLKCQQPWKVK